MENKKKGFTLVELVIVVTLLIVIAGIFSVNFIKNLNKQKEISSTDINAQVVASANAYVSMYPSAIEDLYDGFAFVNIPVGILRDNGLLSEKITNPSTGENIGDDEIVRVRFGAYDNLEFEFPVEDKDLTDDSWILIAQTLYLDKSDNPVNWCDVEENIYTGLVTDKSLINTIKSKLYLMNRKGEFADNIYRTEEVDLKTKSCNVDVTKEGNYYIDYTFKDPSTFQQKEKRRNVVVKNTSDKETMEKAMRMETRS